MSRRLSPGAALLAALLLAGLTGGALARGHLPLAALPAALALALAAAARQRVSRALRQGEEAAALAAELERRGRELQESLLRLEAARTHLGVTDRLAAVGRLAGGVAHAVNNPLAVALANLDWLRESWADALAGRGGGPSPEELLAALAEAVDAGRRVAAIVRDLQDFAQERAGGDGAADLAAVLEHVLRLVTPEARVRARLVVERLERPLLVGGSPTRVAQLLTHLLLHAAHAVPEGNAEENEVRVAVRAEGGGAIVEVRDTGRVLSDDALEHVFDPFYASWSDGEAGTGLGLGVCHGLVGALGGEITAERAPGRGSLYRVRLPGPSAQARLTLGSGGAGRPRVLVVDDEPLVCASLYRVLARDFDVVPHTSPRQALSQVQAGERFDAVLCDLMMPEMSGEAFHAELTRVRPPLAARVVFLTGGAFTPGAREFLERVPNPHLPKPFQAAELVRVLASRCLAGPSPTP